MHRGDLNNKQLQLGLFASAIPLALSIVTSIAFQRSTSSSARGFLYLLRLAACNACYPTIDPIANR
jgi:hypothetical protein